MRHLFVAGFDFGTSYSKVVLRDQLTNVAKAVTFGSDQRSGLLPSFVRVGNRVFYGPECTGGVLIISYPKLIATDAASGS
jgi:molecular chaperone DnaK (HSP70)